MVIKADKQRLRGVLLDAISLLCKSSLPVDAAFSIEATIGITISETDIVLISFKEIVQPDLRLSVSEPSQPATICSPLPTYRPENSDVASDLNESLTMSHCTSVSTRNIWNNVQDTFPVLDECRIPRGTVGVMSHSSIKSTDAYTNLVNSSPSNEKTDRKSNQWHQISTELPLQCLNPGMSNILTAPVKEETLEGDFRDFERQEKEGMYVESVDIDGGNEAWLQAVDTGVLDASICPDGELNQDENQMGVDDVSNLQYNTEGSYAHVKGDNKSFSRPSRYFKVRRRFLRQNIDRSQGRSAAVGPQSSTVQPVTQVFSSASIQSALNSAAATVASQSMEGGAAICQICGARLSSASTLIKHIKGTHLEMSMCQCEICGQQFKWTMQLCRHRKRYHSDVLYATPSTCATVPTSCTGAESLHYVQQSNLSMLSELSD